jgi:hypothetical protein
MVDKNAIPSKPESEVGKQAEPFGKVAQTVWGRSVWRLLRPENRFAKGPPQVGALALVRAIQGPADGESGYRDMSDLR